MNTKKKINKKEELIFVELIKLALPRQIIANYLNISIETVYLYIKRFNLKTNKRVGNQAQQNVLTIYAHTQVSDYFWRGSKICRSKLSKVLYDYMKMDTVKLILMHANRAIAYCQQLHFKKEVTERQKRIVMLVYGVTKDSTTSKLLRPRLELIWLWNSVIQEKNIKFNLNLSSSNHFIHKVLEHRREMTDFVPPVIDKQLCDVKIPHLWGLLDDRQQDILERYAAGNTLANIGEYYNLSRERIRKIKNAALAKVRKYSLQDFICRELKKEAIEIRRVDKSIPAIDILKQKIEDQGFSQRLVNVCRRILEVEYVGDMVLFSESFWKATRNVGDKVMSEIREFYQRNNLHFDMDIKLERVSEYL